MYKYCTSYHNLCSHRLNQHFHKFVFFFFSKSFEEVVFIFFFFFFFLKKKKKKCQVFYIRTQSHKAQTK